MTKPEDPHPPKPTRRDAIIQGVKAGISGPGGILSALLKTPLEKRRDKWMAAVESALIEIENKVEGFSIDALSENELFVSSVLQATVAAQRTHQEEKLAALRNAVMNIALGKDLDETRTEILLNLIDSLSVWHIRILDLFANPDNWATRNNRPFPDNWHSGGREQLLEFAYPELANKRTFYDPIVSDLHTKGLLSTDSLHTMMTRSGMTQPAITEWGGHLVLMIREPDLK